MKQLGLLLQKYVNHQGAKIAFRLHLIKKKKKVLSPALLSSWCVCIYIFKECIVKIIEKKKRWLLTSMAEIILTHSLVLSWWCSFTFPCRLHIHQAQAELVTRPYFYFSAACHAWTAAFIFRGAIPNR